MVDERIEARLTELRTMSNDFARAYAQRNFLEELKKTKIAVLMKQAEVEGHKSAAAQEREARASDEYVELLVGLQEATEQSEKLRWHLEIAKMNVQIWQTKESTKRMELQVYGRT